jgi:integrase
VATFQKRGKRWRAIVRRSGVAESKSFPTKAAAQEWARRIEHGADLGHVQEYTKPVAADTVAWMLKEYTDAVSPIKPFGRSKSATLAALARDLGDIPLKELNATRLNKFVADRAASGAGGVTISVDLSYLKTAMRWLQAVRRVSVNVQAVQDARDAMKYSGLSTESQERDRRPEDDELAALYAYWRANPRMKIPMQDLCEFAIASAMRVGEICRLQWEDLDENKKTIIIRDRKDPRRKIGNHQTVPLLDATGIDALAIIKRQKGSAGRIFPYDAKSVSTAFTRAVSKCKIEDLHFHDLRHEGTSRLFESRRFSLPEVALVTGHKDWKQLARYTQTRAETLHRKRRAGGRALR